MDLLIKNARLVDCSMNTTGDIYIKDGIIASIGKDIEEDCRAIDAEGKILMPSFVDLHCHFREPGYTHKEDIESGSRAAAKGGFTAVNLMANTKPICSSMEVVNQVLQRGEEVGLTNIHQVVSITKDMEGTDTSHLKEIKKENIRLISDDGKGVSSNLAMYEAMKIAAEKDWIVVSHAEDKEFSKIDMRIAEDMMTQRDIELARITGCQLHMAHVSTIDSMRYIIEGKKRGIKVTCEVTPHHIALINEESNYRVNPPIRNREDLEYLIEAIKGGWVDAIGTDHAPHTAEDKKNGAPGISGLETAFSVCYTKLVKDEHISLSKLSKIMSKKPAEIMKINKGKLEIGYDGDLVLVDIDRKILVDSEQFVSRGKNTPFHGREYFGEILMTVKRGKVVYRK
jgi:dihydroorotase